MIIKLPDNKYLGIEMFNRFDKKVYLWLGEEGKEAEDKSVELHEEHMSALIGIFQQAMKDD